MVPNTPIENQIDAVLQDLPPQERRIDFYGVLSAEIKEKLRGKVIALCERQVVVGDSLVDVEQQTKVRWAGKSVSLISGLPTEDITLAELEGRTT